MRSSVSDIKRARKEANFFRAISELFINVARDEPLVRDLIINRVTLSPNGSNCIIYFYVPGGQEVFKEKLKTLKLYKPSMRKAISNLIPGRYTPELTFKYDDAYEKQRKIEDLLDSIQHEEK